MVPVKPHIARNANLVGFDAYHRMYRQSLDDPEAFWRGQTNRLSWILPPETILDSDGEHVDRSWFGGGLLNVSYNCVDRHAQDHPNKPALIWARNDGSYEHISFTALKRSVARVANVLRAHGVRRGDTVCIYMPMIPELAYTMLACTRIGAVHSVVFAGFSAESLRERILDAGAQIVVTANEGLRGDKTIPLKAIVDTAAEGLGQVRAVLVARRTGAMPAMRPGRDVWLDDEMQRQRPSCPLEWMNSEDPLFILYTSGSTGKPKGVLHTTAGYLLYAAMTHYYVFDAKPDDVHFCTADIGWITGHSYVLYGPLSNGNTSVIFESIPTHPDPGRYWRIVEELGVTTFYTAPTALRALMAHDEDWVRKYDRSSLRVIGSVGEPINPEVWTWYHDVVGNGRAAVVDTFWQTETGGIMVTPLPGVTPCKPGSATLPFFGVEPVIVDEAGQVQKRTEASGNLCFARSWPAQARTIHGDHRRFLETYYSRFPPLYFTGDGCHRDADGYLFITGRVDDVLNVAGHRLGTAEIESALVSHESVIEAAVVGAPHAIKGTGIVAYVVVRRHQLNFSDEQLVGALKEHVRQVIGAIATPDQIHVVDGLPKTRSGKIVRRMLRKIASGELHDLGDQTTLADPLVLERLLQTSSATVRS
jgi:acetyl-CoA synthetase